MSTLLCVGVSAELLAQWLPTCSTRVKSPGSMAAAASRAAGSPRSGHLGGRPGRLAAPAAGSADDRSARYASCCLVDSCQPICLQHARSQGNAQVARAGSSVTLRKLFRPDAAAAFLAGAVRRDFLLGRGTAASSGSKSASSSAAGAPALATASAGSAL